MSNNIEYSFWPGRFAASNEKFLTQCSNLYSNHYGVWSDKGLHPKEHIKLSNNRLREWLENDYVTVYFAMDREEIIGYAISFSKNEYNYGIVTWVTQLVVHDKYRQRGIAKNLLFSIWGFSNHFAWGIVSANPYAIRALEKATRRRAVPMRIKKNSTKLKNIGRQNVPFIYEDTQFQITEDSAAVNTNFFVDHSDTMQMLKNVITEEVPWNLGLIDEGWEWFAFTFNDQKQIELSQQEIENMIAASDSVVYQAYSKMNPKKQNWMKHSSEEVDYIINKTKLSSTDFVYDLGCGIGRHSLELAKRNIKVVGIDYIPENVSLAIQKAEELSLRNLKFLEADCRYFKNRRKASHILCLYDVIGTFASDDNNYLILQNAFNLLNSGGYAIFSVMNYESTFFNAKYLFSFANDANKILELPASNTQEETGDIFNPDYYLVDTETHLIYRKEQFSSSTGLPIKLIVRDRRFTMDEIISLCKSVGFSIVEAKYTNASDWNKSYAATSSRAKEILLICQKPKEEIL